MNNTAQIVSSPKVCYCSRPKIGYWRRLLAASLMLGLTAFFQVARANLVVLDDDFNNATNNLANNDLGIGGGFGSFTAGNTPRAYETNSLAVIASTFNGADRANIASQNGYAIGSGGTLFDFQNVRYTNTTTTVAGTTDRLILGVLGTNSPSDWFEGTLSNMPTGFYIEPNSDVFTRSSATALLNDGWASRNSVLFYHSGGTNVAILAHWQFQTLTWNQGVTANYSPVLDIQLTLSPTGWGLNITGDVNTNGQPISFTNTYAASGITNVLLNGLQPGFVCTEGQTESPCIQQSIDRIVVTDFGNPVVTTPLISTPQYINLFGYNTNTLFAGDTLQLSSLVYDSATAPALPTLQWQVSNAASSGTFTNLPGGTGTNITVNTASLGDGLAHGFRLVASDGVNSATSAVVAVTINPATPPIINSDVTPVGATTLYVGEGILFSTVFIGSQPIYYQWQASPLNDGINFTNIPGATNTTYTILAVGLGNAGYYQCLASNAYGTTLAYGGSSLVYLIVNTGPPFPTYLWSAPIRINSLNADQILTNFPGTKVAGALVGKNGGNPIIVTNSSADSPIVFAGAGAWATLSGGAGYTTAANINTNQTGNANFNTCLGDAYDNNTPLITMSGLVLGQQYQVQLFGLDNRSGLSPLATARLVTWQDPNNVNDKSQSIAMADNVYMLATFTATNTVMAIQENTLNTSSGNFNCLVLRAVGWNPPPYFTTMPAANVGNVLGGNVSLSGNAAGDVTVPSPAITFQWQAGPTNGPYTNLVAGAKYAITTTTTNSTLTISNLTFSDGLPVYLLIASDGGGSTTSIVANVYVQSAPVPPAPGSYGAFALSLTDNKPVAFWQLNETNNPGTGTVLAYDFTGNGHNGTYISGAQNAYNGITGPTNYPGFAANQGALYVPGAINGVVSVPALGLNTNPAAITTNGVTISMWIKPTANIVASTGLLFNRGSQVDGFGFGGTLNGAGMAGLGYTWNNNSATTYNYSSGLYPVLNIWQYVALVVNSNAATIYLYYINPSTGQPVLLSAVQNIALNAYTWNNATTYIGADSNGGRNFTGDISDVAVYNSALSPTQILQQFGASIGVQGFGGVINSQPPAYVTNYVGFTVQLTAATGGNAPLTNRWQFNNTNLVDGVNGGAIIIGSTSNVLTIYGVTTNFQGVFNLTVSNSLGGTISSNVNLIVLTPVAPSATNLVGAWLTGAASLADASGYTPGGIHDGYGVTGLGVPATNYAFTTDVPQGAAGKSLQLNGNTAIAIANSSTNDAGYTNTYDDTIHSAMTVVCWAKGTPGGWNPWVSKYGEGPGWQLRINNSSDPCWTIRGTGGTEDMATSANTPTDGNWHFYCGTYDVATGVRNLYVDGNLAASQTGQGAYNMAPAERVTIGGKDQPPSDTTHLAGNFTGYFTGEIYGVRIYNIALSGAQQASFVPKPALPAPAFSVKPVVTTGSKGKQFVLTWSYGTLLQATNIAGPWTTNTATQPYTVIISNAPAMFFKLSNP